MAVFAHWSARDELEPFIVAHLRALRAVADRVVLVSTADLSPHAVEKAREVADEVHVRPNVGFDFSMWRFWLEREDLTRWDELILTNSSVFGPLVPLDRVFKRMEHVSFDAWSMTENAQVAWHLQSYFLVFRARVLASSAFHTFWSSVRPYRNKWRVIRSYEVGLSRHLIAEGFRLGSFATAVLPPPNPPDPFAALRGSRANPTLSHPIELLRLGMPYVKIELLRDNPLHVDLEPVRRAMRDMHAASYPELCSTFDRRG